MSNSGEIEDRYLLNLFVSLKIQLMKFNHNLYNHVKPMKPLPYFIAPPPPLKL